ncbi:MAG: type ISP restriction/modification enzyme, partial [Patescibacteria group bacterium]
MVQNVLENYLQSISSKFAREETSEMGYRTDFEILLKGIFESINVSRFDHDPRSKQGNKPDFVVQKNNVPILYIETKNIGVSLDKIEKSEQMSRYFGYANLVLTDYTEFRFYRNGLPYGEPIKIAECDKNARTITPLPKNFEYLAKTLIDFTQSHKEPIRSGKHLAKIMGGKAQRIRDNVRHFLAVSKSEKNIELIKIYKTIKRLLVHDLTEETFADLYAQTLVYGLFVARFHDKTPSDFSRREAIYLIPQSNPLLRHFFNHIVGPDFDKRLEYIVDELCEVFTHADVEKLMKDYYQKDLWNNEQKGPDPVIHFYEDFLKEYDPELRKKMGAYYTPLPVVTFIIQSVDYLLKKEFVLTEGLADTTRTVGGLHKVQILDPAVGTGTFISAVIDKIYKKFKDQEGRWPTYVQNDLLPRIHGFELMMAPYTIAHLKISMTLKEKGFKYFNKKRLEIYLTNSLEETVKQEDLFSTFGLAGSIAEESKEATIIKNKTPIMVVIGNPPYSVSSSNKGEWITNLTKVYKENLNEKNIQPLSDDYIKFIRFAEHFIEKNKTGIVAMITNNSFLDGIIHRQMRKHLLETFDDIYILDLHGNSKKKETTPDGNKDENIFNIQQGVSINVFVRKKIKKTDLGAIYHTDLFGKRQTKFETLKKGNLKTIKWQKLDSPKPYYFFVPKDFKLEKQYKKGFKIKDLFIEKTVGCVTSKDLVFLADNDKVLEKQITKVYPNTIYEKKSVRNYLYRPFDLKKIYYDPNLLGRSRKNVLSNFYNKNFGLIVSKQFGSHKHFIVFITKDINDKSSQPFAPYYNHPLYLYLEDGTKIPNLKQEIVDEIEKNVGKTTPENVFDYIYAVLHSPNYRKKYKEFLKIDFPRVPYPKDKITFKKLVKLGRELRSLHL